MVVVDQAYENRYRRGRGSLNDIDTMLFTVYLNDAGGSVE